MKTEYNPPPRPPCPSHSHAHLPVSSSVAAVMSMLREVSTRGVGMMVADSGWMNLHDFIQTALDRFVHEQAGALVRFGRNTRKNTGGWAMFWVPPEVERFARFVYLDVAFDFFGAHLFLSRSI